MDVNSNLAQRQLIKSLVSENKYYVAYNILIKILPKYPKDYEILSQIAYITFKMELYSESLIYYKQCIDINNFEIQNSFISNWFNYYQYAKLLHIDHKYNIAKEYYIKSLKLNNCNLLIYYDIAQLYIDIKNYNQSQIYFEQYFDLINNSNIITKNKNNNNIHIIHYKYSQLLFYKLNKKNYAKSHIEIAIKLNKNNSLYTFKYALMLKNTQSIKKSKKYFIKSIQLTKYKNDIYLFQYGIFLTDILKDIKNGMIHVKKAFDLKPNNKRYKNEYNALKNWHNNNKNNNNKSNTKSNVRYNREIYNSIKRDARRINFDTNKKSNTSNNNKYDAEILEFKKKFNIACQAQAEHNYTLAKNILEELILITPEDGEIYGRLAFAEAQLGGWGIAEKYYQKSLILSPRNYVTMYNYAFLLYYKLQRYADAEILYKKSLRIKPNCAKALLNYARLLDTIKKTKLSEEYYRICLSGSPNYDLCFYYFGCFLYRQERYKEAQYYLQKAVNCWPHSHLHHFRLAVTCHVLCQYNKCQYHLKEALKIKPDFIAAIEAYQRYGYNEYNYDTDTSDTINTINGIMDQKHLRMYDRRNQKV